MTFWEKLYLPEIVKGLGYTFKKMGKPTVTEEYPEKQWYPPDSYRGRPVLVEEKGQARCVACGLCARSCPPMAISMQAEETDSVVRNQHASMHLLWFLRRSLSRGSYCYVEGI